MSRQIKGAYTKFCSEIMSQACFLPFSLAIGYKCNIKSKRYSKQDSQYSDKVFLWFIYDEVKVI
jgi:hypothetical protein